MDLIGTFMEQISVFPILAAFSALTLFATVYCVGRVAFVKIGKKNTARGSCFSLLIIPLFYALNVVTLVVFRYLLFSNLA